MFGGILTMKHGVTSESLVFLFLLGGLLLNAPLLSIFDVPDYVLGIPILYVYLFAVWAILVMLMALAIGTASTTVDAQDPGGDTAVEDRID